MTVQEYLKQIEKLDRKIDCMVNELNTFRQSAYGVSGVGYGERVQTSPKQDTTGIIIAKAVILEEEIREMESNLTSLKRAISTQLSRLDNQAERDILFDRYFCYKSIYQIAKEQKKDYRNLKHLHKKALANFEKCLTQIK